MLQRLFNLHTAISFGFGFLTPLVVPGLIFGFFGLLICWFNLPDSLHLDLEKAWTGGFIFVGLAILLGTIAVNVIG